MPVVFVEKYGRNTRSRRSAGIPGPLSVMTTWTCSPRPVRRDHDLGRPRLDGVVDEIQDGLLELVAVGVERRQVPREVGAEDDGRMRLAVEAEHALQQPVEVRRSGVKLGIRANRENSSTSRRSPSTSPMMVAVHSSSRPPSSGSRPARRRRSRCARAGSA